MCMHVRTRNTIWKYCQVEIQNVFIRAKTMIIWKRSEISWNKKIRRISLYLSRNSNIKFKFSITGKRVNHLHEISRMLKVYRHYIHYNRMLLVFQLLKMFDRFYCICLPRALGYNDISLYMLIYYKGRWFLKYVLTIFNYYLLFLTTPHHQPHFKQINLADLF